MRASFNIYGLRLEVVADHPTLFEVFVKDLRAFQRPHRARTRGALRLTLTALPDGQSGMGHPVPRGPDHEIHEIGHRSRWLARRVDGTRYGRFGILVSHDVQRRHIRAQVIPDPLFVPDPMYHYGFTHPVGLWLKRRGMFFLHAGCVAEGGRGILLAGHPGAGKSTLTLSAVRAGFAALGDEQPLLTQRRGALEVLAFPRRIRINRTDAMRFPELHALAARAPWERVIFSLEEVWPGRLADRCEPRLLIFPRFRTHGSLRLTRLDGAQALARLLQDEHFFWYQHPPWRRISVAHLKLFESLVRRAPAYHLDYGARDIDKVPDRLRRLLHA